MNKQHHPMDRRFANEVHRGTAPGHRQARIRWELTVEEAAVRYELNPSSVKGYLRLYRAETGRDESAIAETSSKYGGLCNHIANNILSNYQDREKCLNDTYLAVWNAIPDKHPNRFSVFLTVEQEMINFAILAPGLRISKNLQALFMDSIWLIYRSLILSVIAEEMY